MARRRQSSVASPWNDSLSVDSAWETKNWDRKNQAAAQKLAQMNDPGMANYMLKDPTTGLSQSVNRQQYYAGSGTQDPDKPPPGVGTGQTGYAEGGRVKSESPREEDTVYGSTAPAWRGIDPYQASMLRRDDIPMGYADGGDVQDDNGRERLAEAERQAELARTGYQESTQAQPAPKRDLLHEVLDFGRNLLGISSAHAEDAPPNPNAPPVPKATPPVTSTVTADPYSGGANTTTADSNVDPYRGTVRPVPAAPDPHAPVVSASGTPRIPLQADQRSAGSGSDNILQQAGQAFLKPMRDDDAARESIISKYPATVRLAVPGIR